MIYSNDQLGIEIEIPDSWEVTSHNFNNVEPGLEDLFLKHGKGLIDEEIPLIHPDDPTTKNEYKYLFTADQMSHNQKSKRMSVVLCVHRAVFTREDYLDLMLEKVTPRPEVADQYTMIRGTASHGEHFFGYLDLVGMESVTRHAWANIARFIWLYAHLTDYKDVSERHSLKWFNKIKKIPRYVPPFTADPGEPAPGMK